MMEPSGTLLMVMALLGIVVYMLPWIVALNTGNRPTTVFWVTLLTGWTTIGWVVGMILALLAPNDDSDRMPCPECREPIQPDAKRCPHCQAELAGRGVAEAAKDE